MPHPSISHRTYCTGGFFLLFGSRGVLSSFFRLPLFLGSPVSSTIFSSTLTSSSTLSKLSITSVFISATSFSFLGHLSFSFSLFFPMSRRSSALWFWTFPFCLRVIALVIQVISKRNIFITANTFFLFCTTLS